MLKINETDRTSRMKSNIFYSFIIKMLGVGINLLFVPLTIKLINPERYGIWLTISSIIAWFSLLDIGFGNGLRNKYAAARDDRKEQQKLIHTTIFVLVLISGSIAATYLLFLNHAKWDRLIGVSPAYREELQLLLRYLVMMFALQFILQIITPVMYAIEKPSRVAANILLGNLFGLAGILLLKHYNSATLVSLGLVVMGGNLLSFFFFFAYFFFLKRPDLLSTFHIPTGNNIKSIFNLGFKFFVLNIAYVVQYQSTNFLISRNFSPEKVTQFNIAFKLFSLSTVVFGIIVSPVWSSVTNAQVHNDFEWIYRIVKRLFSIWSLITVGCVLVLAISPHIYHAWIGHTVEIPYLISLGVVLVVSTNSFSSIFIQTLNGLSLVNVQFWLSIVTILTFIPVAYFLSVTLKMEVFGICLAIVITNINGIIVAPIQLVRYLSKMKKTNESELILTHE